MPRIIAIPIALLLLAASLAGCAGDDRERPSLAEWAVTLCDSTAIFKQTASIPPITLPAIEQLAEVNDKAYARLDQIRAAEGTDRLHDATLSFYEESAKVLRSFAADVDAGGDFDVAFTQLGIDLDAASDDWTESIESVSDETEAALESAPGCLP